MSKKSSPSEFTWTLAAKIADAAKAHFERSLGGIGHVEVFGGPDGVFVTDEQDRCSVVTVDDHAACDPVRRAGDYIARLSGFHTREQWVHQLHALMGRLPLLTEANGWVEDAPVPVKSAPARRRS